MPLRIPSHPAIKEGKFNDARGRPGSVKKGI